MTWRCSAQQLLSSSSGIDLAPTGLALGLVSSLSAGDPRRSDGGFMTHDHEGAKGGSWVGDRLDRGEVATPLRTERVTICLGEVHGE